MNETRYILSPLRMFVPVNLISCALECGLLQKMEGLE